MIPLEVDTGGMSGLNPYPQAHRRLLANQLKKIIGVCLRQPSLHILNHLTVG
jgi:hypothetical protein